MGVLLLLLSLVTVMPAFAAVRGASLILDPADVTKELVWARQGGTVVLQVTDADLNVAVTVADESVAYTACAALGDLKAGLSLANAPVLDNTGDGVVNFADVVVGPGGNASTTVFSVDGNNGKVTLQCTGASATVAQKLNYKAAGVDTVGTALVATSIVKVTSATDATGIGVILTETGVNTGIFRKTIALSAGVSVENVNIKVGLSDVLKVSYTDAAPTPATAVADTVTVESTAPAGANFVPANNFGTQSSRPVVSADVTDLNSGLKKTSIHIIFAVDAAPFNDIIDGPGTEVVVDSDGTLAAITNGWHLDQRLPAAMTPITDAQIFWWVVADDTAGNHGVSDRDTTEVIACDPSTFPAAAALGGVLVTTTALIAQCQPFVVRVDFTSPAVTAATTGYWWDTTIVPVLPSTDQTQTTASKAKKTSIAVNFNEDLDASTVAASDFTVDGVAPSAAAVYSGKASTVFLTVSTMAADAKPVVKLVGSVTDVAGNALTIAQATAADKIPPTITPAAITGVTKDKVTIKFTTDEDVVVDGSSVVVKIQATATTLGVANLATSAPSLIDLATKTWSIDVTPGGAGVFNVQYAVKDLGGVSGTKGSGDPSAKTAVLFEKDVAVGAPTFIPAATTSNPNTFITIDYTAEGAEYGLDAVGAFTAVAALVVTSKDTRGKVTLTSATLDGVSILSSIATADNIRFLYNSSGLALGDHTVKVIAKDDAGNTSAEVSGTFKVVAVPAFDVTLNPGWNLVSIAADPVDPAINSVIAKTHPIDTVLAYDASTGTWLVATRDATTGLLKGTLTSITSKWALWVHTNSFQKLSVTLATRDASGVLPPTLKLKAGWNLVPVNTLDANPVAGKTVLAKVYLKGTGAIRAYSFDTAANGFVSVDPTDIGANGDVVVAGAGYLVFVPKDIDLVP